MMPTAGLVVTGLYQQDSNAGPKESRRFDGYRDEPRYGIVALSYPVGELAWATRRQ
jgi:hypothetical protein